METVGTVFGEVSVKKIGDAVYSARIDVPKGAVFFEFSEFSFSRQSVDCVMKIDFEVTDGRQPSFSQRVDLRSASARSNLATALNSAYGNKTAGYNWVLILNNVFTRVIGVVQTEQKPVSIVGRQYEEIPFLLYPFLQTNVSNLLFAASEAGKTWFALRMAVAMVVGSDFLNYHAKGGVRTLFIDYEDDIHTFSNRIHRLCAGMQLSYDDVASHIEYYKPSGSLRDNAEILRRMIASRKFGFIIIDAGGDAAGGSPSDEEKVLDLFNTLEEIKCTKLILHHEPKAVQNQAAAFYGSMYWKARTRVGWRLEVESDDGKVKVIKASIQKRSNLPYIEPIYYKTEFADELLHKFVGAGAPPVTLELAPAAEENPKSIYEEIEDLLSAHSTLTPRQIADLTHREISGVRKALKKLEDKRSVQQIAKGASTVWKLK